MSTKAERVSDFYKKKLKEEINKTKGLGKVVMTQRLTKVLLKFAFFIMEQEKCKVEFHSNCQYFIFDDSVLLLLLLGNHIEFQTMSREDWENAVK